MKQTKKLLSTALALSLGAGALAAVGSTGYTDVPSGSWYALAVDWARASSIVHSYEDGCFLLQESLIRAQLAAILQAYLTAKEPAETELADEEGIVRTTAGLVQGTDHDGIYRYLGISYAQTEERFVPTVTVEPWEGVRQADDYGPISPQGALLGMGGAGDMPGADNNLLKRL